jgi:hypothetical protein
MEELTLAIYDRAAAHAATRGILLADTKFEFGLDPAGQMVLADEVLTPDSSRFWPAEGYAPGRVQPSFDKQFVRDYLESIEFDKSTPVELPQPRDPGDAGQVSGSLPPDHRFRSQAVITGPWRLRPPPENHGNARGGFCQEGRKTGKEDGVGKSELGVLRIRFSGDRKHLPVRIPATGTSWITR